MIISENIPENDSLVKIVEDYVSDATSKKRQLDPNFYKQRFRKLRINSELFDEILDDLNSEVEKEQMALMKESNAKLLMIGGLFSGIALMIITILSALKLILNGAISYLMFGGIASCFLASMKGFNDLKDKKRRKEVRAILWHRKYE